MTPVMPRHTRRSFTSAAALAFGVLILVSLSSRPAYADSCGFAENGPNWVSQCVSQVDRFFSNAWIILRIAGVELPEIHLEGDTVIDRRARMPMGPVLDTEILEMMLEGVVDGMTFRLTEPVGARSLGQVSQNPDGITATGFFDVFFQIDGPFPFGPLHNVDPLRVTNNQLLYLPPVVVPPDPLPPSPVDPGMLPGYPYVYQCGTGPCVQLFDSQGVARAEVVRVIHLPKVPEPSTLLLLGAGLIGLARSARRRHRPHA